MRLEQALDLIASLNDEDVVFAKRPWRLDTEAAIGQLDTDSRVPREMSGEGFEYFIEVTDAREVLAVLGDRTVTASERRELLLYYAENDAYPAWVYKT